MRNFGGLLLLVGFVGFLYSSSQLSKAGPVPEGKSLSESWSYEAGRLEVARYGAAFLGCLGVLLLLFPKGR